VIEKLFEEAFSHHQAGRLGDAERLYREVLSADANHCAALHLLGVLSFQTARAEIAAALIGKAIAIDKTQPAYYYNLGIALQALGCLREAGAAYSAALELAPNYAEARNNVATVLADLGFLERAVGEYRIAVRLKPDYADAHNNLGSALARLGRREEAVGAYQTALRLKPDYVQAHTNLGLALQDLGRFEEAADHYGEAFRLKPDHSEAIAQQLYCLRQICDWRVTDRLERDLLLQTGKYSPFLSLIVDSSAEQRLAVAKTWSAQFAKLVPLPPRPRSGDAKIRLGYLSADFCNHAVAQLVVELIERHDRGRFEVIGYSYGPDDGSHLRQRLMQGFDQFKDIRPLANAGAARLIREDGIDILVDLTGYTAKGRTEILAYRPAPVQVNFLGYPGTMGADFIDYLIADPICIPAQAEAGFREKIVRLPCYQPNDSQRPVAEETPSRAEAGLPERGVIFCCFNNSFKITPALFAIWMRLLDKTPGSVLWLLDTNQSGKDNLRREAQAAGVSSERLVFAPRIALRDHLARHRLADLFLDTLPYNAHTTASDALWVGLPVLTCLGESFAGRVAASLLTAVGMEEMITSSLAEYEALALKLAADPARITALKAKLAANRPTAPLFDSQHFAREIEAAYERMIE
jgi:predicted O-linked N-acetylglucosamine transferase (SPINDLY family)